MNQDKQFEKFKQKNLRRLKDIIRSMCNQYNYGEAYKIVLNELSDYIKELEDSP